MATPKGIRKVCKDGHVFYKSSDCPVCPQCENDRRPADGFLSKIAAPARRALANASIDSLTKLAQLSEDDLKKLHGMGPKAIAILKTELRKNNLELKK